MSFAPRSRFAKPAPFSRRTSPRCRGGASSMLRLAQPEVSRLPSRIDVVGWVRRAGEALSLAAAPAVAPSEFTVG